MSHSILNRKTTVGNTGVEIPALCFGTSGLGDMPVTYGYSTPEDRAHNTITHILHSAFPFLDSSRNYGNGRSEQRIGQVVQELGGLPNNALISTKLDRDMHTGRFDASRARRSLEESLQALHIDTVDILHLHDPEHADSMNEICAADGALPELFRMKEEGLCKAVGLAAGRVDIMMPLLAEWPFDILISHNRYTLVNHNANDMFDFAMQKGIVVMNAAPYAGGIFAKGSTQHPRYVYQKANNDMIEPVARMEALCARHGIPTGAAALQFSLRDPRIATTICGVTRPERVDQTLQWAECNIPDAFWEEFSAIEASREDPEATREYKPD